MHRHVDKHGHRGNENTFHVKQTKTHTCVQCHAPIHTYRVMWSAYLVKRCCVESSVSLPVATIRWVSYRRSSPWRCAPILISSPLPTSHRLTATSGRSAIQTSCGSHSTTTIRYCTCKATNLCGRFIYANYASQVQVAKNSYCINFYRGIFKMLEWHKGPLWWVSMNLSST